MEQYQIEPWDHITTVSPGTVLEQYVPPELEALGRQVMEQYDMKVSSMVLITSKPDKGGAIWKIETDKGPRSIKVLHRHPQRSLFSVGAQEYLVQVGARVPALIPTIDGRLYVEAGGKSWIVTDWIETLVPASKIDLEGAAQLCQGLGEFHTWTKGYKPPAGASKSSRLHGWIKYYQKIIAKIGWFRHIAEAYNETAGSGPLLQVVDDFERQAVEALERLNNSEYANMVAMGEPHWGLAHQDYGWSNGQMGPGGIWVIDLDGVSYDLPFRDLRKIITSTMDDMGVWDITWIRGMIEAYHLGNPFDQQMFEILWIDMAFPNEFYKHVKEMVFDPVNFLNLELMPILQRVLATESTKWQVLQELYADKEKYPLGTYEPQYVPEQWSLALPSEDGSFVATDQSPFFDFTNVSDNPVSPPFVAAEAPAAALPPHEQHPIPLQLPVNEAANEAANEPSLASALIAGSELSEVPPVGLSEVPVAQGLITLAPIRPIIAAPIKLLVRSKKRRRKASRNTNTIFRRSGSKKKSASRKKSALSLTIKRRKATKTSPSKKSIGRLQKQRKKSLPSKRPASPYRTTLQKTKRNTRKTA
ncbi:CotS family spore coat protein [Paenibacillus sp. ACRRX]|uniref:CotS family spore coat protein n=1 Tax=Paenibacillus sp. ACRRX TaxID=2918206 RepID=UPI001EF56547|nr:CotS family spore coat protein [Paenibacillus sp. ACRRX]MCG7405807.1 CotS family spore coat protein [Paenibacillus sp. ACRRX]